MAEKAEETYGTYSTKLTTIKHSAVASWSGYGYQGGIKGLGIDNYSDGSYSRFGVSASFGLAAEWCNTIRLKIGYDLGLTDLNKSDNVSYKQDLLTFSLGYIF